MNFIYRHIPEFVATLAAMLILLICWRRMVNHHRLKGDRRLWLAFNALMAFVGVVMAGGLLLRSARVGAYFPPALRIWTGSVALSIVLTVVIVAVTYKIAQMVPRSASDHSPGRRRLLLAARGAVFATPVAAAGYAVFIQRSDLSPREVEVPIAGLPKELQGLRLVQLSDIHLSPFLSERELARAVDMANEFRPHIALVTGDLITSSYDPLDRCIGQLARLRAEAGVIGCLGNHETYANAEDYTQQTAGIRGIEFLRMNSRVFTFGGKSLNFAGVDYQKMKLPYLEGAERLVQPGMPNILLSHNPDVFPVAASKGYDVTLSGHTHGGQISVEILQQNLSVARFYTPYVYGLYRKGNASIYVTRGIGTVGVPARFGAPPEIAFIRLCAI